VAGVIDGLRGGLIVSCQAPPGSPLREPSHLAALAAAAERGGAVAIRAEGVASIRAIRAAVRVPIIGLRKREVAGSPVYITPEVHDAVEVAEAGADVIALDATLRPRPGGESTDAFLRRVRAALGDDVPVLADVDDVGSGQAAAEAGADAVATTLVGYTGTGTGPVPTEPAIEILASLVVRAGRPVIAEGRYSTPQQVADAFTAGAFAVVVGTAITDPLALTRRFAAAAPSSA
jgi:N-acylglucosamine-6-phosphate 2-epimerase